MRPNPAMRLVGWLGFAVGMIGSLVNLGEDRGLLWFAIGLSWLILARVES